MNPTLESVLKSIPSGSDVIDQFTLLCKDQTSRSMVGGVTRGNGSVQVNASGRFLAPGVIICNYRSNNSNSDSAKKKKLDSIPIKVLNPSRKRDKSYMLNLHIDSTSNLKHLREKNIRAAGKGHYFLQFKV